MDALKHQGFATLCRKNGWRCTPQRQAVYEFVNGNLSHPDVDTVWEQVKKRIPSITRESVYRLLNEFTQKGILHRLDNVPSARYDSQTAPHGHFICEACAQIQDFKIPADFPMPTKAAKGTVRHIELRFSGICGKCSTGQHKPKQPKQKQKQKGLK